MPFIKDVLNEIEAFAPKIYQEDYDNAGLITGNASWECKGVLLTLDCIEATVKEAIEKNCNLIVAHHPIIFKALKSITGKNYIERTIIKAIKHDIAIYACHTNLDNMSNGVSKRIADQIGLTNQRVLLPKQNTLLQLQTFVPKESAETVRDALFLAGAGEIGNYGQCSFNTVGTGTFLGNSSANPTIGEKHKLQKEEEVKIEVLLPIALEKKVLNALLSAHPYEEVAYYLTELRNQNQEIGSGIIGELKQEIDEKLFLKELKSRFNAQGIRYTELLNKPIKTVAVCGGSGSFLLPAAIGQGADIYVSSDFKYHEFFDADGQIVIADIGHYESEQFTQEIFLEIIRRKYSNFAVHFSGGYTNPVNYL